MNISLKRQLACNKLINKLKCEKCKPQIQICRGPFVWNLRLKWNCLWLAVGQSLHSTMTLSHHHSIQSCFRCSTDVVNVIWLPAVRFQWPHVAQVDDDLTEMLCSLNCSCLHLCLSHSNHIQWTTVMAGHGCSILPFLEWMVKFFNELACSPFLSLYVILSFVFSLLCSSVSLNFAFSSLFSFSPLNHYSRCHSLPSVPCFLPFVF